MKANEYFAALSKEVECKGRNNPDFEEGFQSGIEAYRTLILKHEVHDSGEIDSSLPKPSV